MDSESRLCLVLIVGIAAGLMVTELIWFAAGYGTSREIHLNLRDLTLVVTSLA